jgi:hypothetical protein
MLKQYLRRLSRPLLFVFLVIVFALFLGASFIDGNFHPVRLIDLTYGSGWGGPFLFILFIGTFWVGGPAMKDLEWLISRFRDWKEARFWRMLDEEQPATKRDSAYWILVIVGIGGALTAALLLFPPWRQTIDIPYRLHSQQTVGYGWIWSPPSPSTIRASIALDWDRLCLEVLALWALMVPLALGIWYRNSIIPRDFNLQSGQGEKHHSDQGAPKRGKPPESVPAYRGTSQNNGGSQPHSAGSQEGSQGVPLQHAGAVSLNSEITHHVPPQEQELTRKRGELALLQAELTERELSLANLRAGLAAFEGRYLREVGKLYAELDEWYAKIAEFSAEADGSEEAKSAAAAARGQAEESYAAAHGEAAKAAEFSPSPELKKLFRDVVRQIHPDNATNDEDRAVRNRLMAEANLAYRRGDADALRRILEEYKSSPESVKGEGVADDLERVLRQIERIVNRLAKIEVEVAELTSSEIAKLMAKADGATASGRNLLAEMTKDLERRIQAARREYEALASKVGAG